MKFKRTYIYFTVLLAAFCCALCGLMPRLAAERENRNYAFVLNFRDLLALSAEAKTGNPAVWQRLSQNGVIGITVCEFTGEEIEKYHPMGAKFIAVDGKAAILLPADCPYLKQIEQYIVTKIPGTKPIKDAVSVCFILPATTENIFSSSVLPDCEALEYCKAHNIPALFRLGSCIPANGVQTAKALQFICNSYPQIKNILPAGFIIAGNPDFLPIADFMKTRGISLSQVEFFKQVGASNAFLSSYPNIIPLHSLTTDEVISKNISRTATIERYVRAIHERSVRFILVRPFDLLMGKRLDAFCEDLGKTQTALAARGYNAAWPEPYKPWTRSKMSVIALALIFVSTVWYYRMRLAGIEKENAGIKEILMLLCLSAVYAAGLWKVSALAKITGGLCAGFAATEAALCALQGKKYALPSLFIIFACGLAIASFYGTAKAALRIMPFSGVKLTLLLPPLLLLYHDLKLRIHDETVAELVLRPAIWGELIVLGCMLVAMLIMALRSDNVSNVPAFELAFRDFLERTLLIRPRTKEILIGYPALVLYWYAVKNDLLPHYREALRVAAVLAFCSAMNTFCHFHTRLVLSIIRVINGWWLGLLTGAAIVFAMSLLRKFYQKTGHSNAA